MRDYYQYIEQINSIENPLEALHYTALLYLDKEISAYTFTRLICNSFVDDHGMDWTDAEQTDRLLTKLAERLTLRGGQDV